MEETSSNGGNPISRSEILGIFVTLSVCLLTQPYGSLLHRYHAMLLWRLNPLACASEALIIAFFLLQTGWEARRKKRNWKDELHLTAAALLFLRANKWDWVEHDNLELTELMEENEVLEVLLASYRSAMADRISTPNRIECERPPATVRSSALEDSGVDLSTVSRRNTLGLEEGLLNDPAPLSRNGEPQDDPAVSPQAAERSELRLKLLGPLVFARREKSVNALAVLSVMSVFFKICANTMPLTFKAWLCALLSGWLAVQTLVLIFQTQKIAEHGSLLVRQRKRDIDRQLGHWRSRVRLRIAIGVVIVAVSTALGGLECFSTNVRDYLSGNYQGRLEVQLFLALPSGLAMSLAVLVVLVYATAGWSISLRRYCERR
jgi:hypothetical protein